MLVQFETRIETEGRGFYPLTAFVCRTVEESPVTRGLCTLFVHHTSASLLICENADPDVRRDLEAFFSRWVPDGDPCYTHTAEGPDDMPAHIRSVLTQTSLSVPIVDGRCGLGTWQGLYLWEHRHAPGRRLITLTLMGE